VRKGKFNFSISFLSLAYTLPFQNLKPNYMKTKLLSLLGLLFGLSSGVFSQTVFSEDFQGFTPPFPTGWSRFNVDGLVPDPQVNYVTDAWVVLAGVGGATDSNAVSTSWYAPAGTSNDWMFTPAIGPIPVGAQLSWNAIATDPNFRDGYEVRIMTAAPTIGNITTSTVLQTVPAENAAWTARTQNLSAYAGQTVYIGFRNNSIDKFILAIDDVTVAVQPDNDVAIDSTGLFQYTIIPKNQVPVAGLPLSTRVRNIGNLTANGVNLTATVYNSSNTVVHTATSGNTMIAPTGTANLSVTSFAPTVADFYMITYSVSMTPTDQAPSNNVDTQYINISNAVYARDNGVVTGTLGIGAGNGGYLGEHFDISATTTLNSVGIFYGAVPDTTVFDPLALVIWSMQADTPFAIIGRTDTVIRPDSTGDYFILPIHGSPLVLTPGKYAFTAVEFGGIVGVGLTDNIFTRNTTWVRWPTSPLGGWANNEDFGPNFLKPYVIRPIFCQTIVPNATVTSPLCTATNGSVTVAPTGGDAPFTYVWSVAGSTATISNLAAGAYLVTITDDNRCSSTASISVTVNNLVLTGAATSTASTCTASNGSVNVVPGNGTPNFTYLWSSGATTSAVGNLAAGTYTVTFSDVNGCSGTGSATISATQTVLTASTSTTQSSCTTNNGSATATLTNGTAPYTYLWSNGATSATISNVGPGTYSLTFTDANGCTGTASASVTTPNGPSALATNTNVTCNGASNGAVTVNVTGGTAPLTYIWSNGATSVNLSNVVAGNYTLTVNDANGCSFVVTTSVTQPAVLAATGTFTNATSGNNGAVNITVTGGTSAYAFAWSNGATTEDIIGLGSGTYTVTITDVNNCTASASFSIISVGISGVEQISKFNVFPNPTNGLVNLEIVLHETTDLKVELADINGKVLFSQNAGNVKSYNRVLNLAEYSSGIYLVRVSAEKLNVVQRLTLTK
jgi:hypothetical protein